MMTAVEMVAMMLIMTNSARACQDAVSSIRSIRLFKVLIILLLLVVVVVVVVVVAAAAAAVVF